MANLLDNISEVIYRLGISNGMNIRELSEISEIPAEIVEEILLSIFDAPFGRIELEITGIDSEEDIREIPRDRLYNDIIWNIHFRYMERIPVQNLESEQKIILSRLLTSVNNEMLLKEFCSDVSGWNAVHIKGTSKNTDQLVFYRNYFKIRNAFIKKKLLKISYKEDETLIDYHVIPFGMVFHSEKQLWYLVGMEQCSGDARAFCLNNMKTVLVLQKHAYVSGFDMREYLKHCFDLDLPEKHDVEVEFENHGNIIKKVKRRLSTRGTLTEKENGDVVFKGTLSGIDDFKRWILGFGSAARVIKPEWLAKEQLEEWKAVTENYRNKVDILASLIE